METHEVVNLVLYAVPLCMGIATIVLSIFGEIDLDTIATLLGIGIFCLGVAGIRSAEK